MARTTAFEHDMEQVRIALAQDLFEQIGLDLHEALEMANRFYAEITSSLETGESVELAEFGRFSLRDGFSAGARYYGSSD